MTDIAFACPFCEQSLEAEASVLGETVTCPSCHRRFQVIPDHPSQPTPRRNPTGADAYCASSHQGRYPLRPCTKCHQAVSVLAEWCPICLAPLTPPTPDDAIKPGHVAGAAALGIAVALGSALALVGTIGAAMEFGGDFITRKAYCRAFRREGAIDCLLYESRDAQELACITSTETIFYNRTAMVLTQMLRIRHDAISSVAIDESQTKTRLLGGEAITVRIDTHDMNNIHQLRFRQKPARDNAARAIAKLNYYATTH